jgi:hypothetical protein
MNAKPPQHKFGRAKLGSSNELLIASRVEGSASIESPI